MKKSFIKRSLVALTFALAVAVMIPAAGSVEAQAAKKVTTQKNYKKAKAVKTGTTVVTVKKRSRKNYYQDNYVKFKAPKTGTYVFTVSSFKENGKKSDFSGCGGLTISKLSNNYPMALDVKTQGGKTRYLNVGTKQMYQFSVKNGEKKVDQYLTKRTATLKLKKGETVYLDMFFTTSKMYTYQLNIKRK